jgi:hypothetical protein
MTKRIVDFKKKFEDQHWEHFSPTIYVIYIQYTLQKTHKHNIRKT